MTGMPSADGVLPLAGATSCSNQLQQRDVGGGAMAQHGLHIEAGMNRHRPHILQRWLPVRAIFDDLVIRARLHAMRRGQHQPWRNQRPRTEITSRADDGDDRAGDAVRLRRAAADDAVSGDRKQQREASQHGGENFHGCSNSPHGACRQAADQAGSSGRSVVAALQR